LIAGVRYESFRLSFLNNRARASLSRDDRMVSPRFGLILKPVEEASVYASYSVSYLPSSGDQFSSLTDITAALDPEKFTNVEAGAKWDVADRVALTASVYQLYRTNTRSTSPIDPTLTVLTGRQRSRGYEFAVTGQPTASWTMAGGFTRQNATITSNTAAATAGATVPLVPATTLSWWNKYQLSSGFAVALGAIHQADMYAAITNTVRLPAFTRFDGAAYFAITGAVDAQVNVENILNEKYYPLANGNNNITPGSPRSVRATLTTHF
jgi:catecholate siderophore receptor